MDKLKYIKLLQSQPFLPITIPSTASKAEKDAIIKEFSRKVNQPDAGETIIIVIQR